MFDFRSAREAEGEKSRKTKLLKEILVVVASYFLLSIGVCDKIYRVTVFCIESVCVWIM